MRNELVMLVALVAMTSFTANASAHESVSSIRSAAVHFVRAHAKNTGSRVKVKAAGPDSRLRLARCGQRLSVFLPPGGRIASRTTVGVRCKGPKPWTIYVPVQVSRFGKVVVATQSFRRGQTPGPGSLKLVSRNLDHLPFGWFNSVADLHGKHFVRSVRQGQVITPAMLTVNDVVHRGQQVVLVAKAAGISVKMAGKALGDAAPNERVRVENLSSHRVIQGVVLSRGVVEVLP